MRVAVAVLVTLVLAGCAQQMPHPADENDGSVPAASTASTTVPMQEASETTSTQSTTTATTSTAAKPAPADAEPQALAAIAAVMVDAKNPEANFGQGSTLAVQDRPDGSEEVVSLMKFHVAGLQGKPLESACMQLKVQSHNIGTDVPATLWSYADSSWGQDTLTWSGVDFTNRQVSVGTHLVTGFHEVVWNVTRVLQSSMGTTVSFLLESDARSYNGLGFEGGDQSHGPKLLVNDPACDSPGQQVPPGTLVMSVSLDDTTPCQGSTVTVYVHAEAPSGPAAGATITSAWHFKSTTSRDSGTTDAQGDATLSRAISQASPDHAVRIDVDAAKEGLVGASSIYFTPKAC